MQGIIVIFNRQTGYLLKDCQTVTKHFKDALQVSVHNGNINLTGPATVRADLVTRRPGQIPAGDLFDFFIDPNDLIQDLERARGGLPDEDMFDAEIFLGNESQNPDESFSIRREDITLLPDASSLAPSFVSGAGDFGSEFDGELLGNFADELQVFDGAAMDVEVPLDYSNSGRQFEQSETGANPFLDQFNLDHDESSARSARVRRRKRSRSTKGKSEKGRDLLLVYSHRLGCSHGR